VRRHAKASTAGSSTGSRLGRFVRGALAIRSVSSGVDGSGAPKAARGARGLLATLPLALFLTFGAASALAAPPTVTIDPPGAHSITTAQVSGTVDPKDHDTYYCFETNPEGQGWSGFCFEGSTEHDTGPLPLTKTLEGLKADTTYQARLTALNFQDPEVFSDPVEFTTDPAPNAPALSIEPATSVSFTKAHIEGEIDPEGGNLNGPGEPVPIAWELQINPEGAGWEFAEGGVIEGAEAESDPAPGAGIVVLKDLENLKPGIEYQFRLHALYAGLEATSAEPNPTFDTDPVALPVLSTDNASAVTDTTAHFSGSVEVSGTDEAFDAACHFDYISQAAFEAAGNTFDGAQQATCTPATVTGAETQPVAVQADVNGLEPNTTYHLRLVAENKGGPADLAAAATFTTGAVGPVVLAATNTPLSESATRVRGYVNPRNSAISDCHFAYGPTSAYGASVPCASNPGSGGEAVTVSADISGLNPASSYHFQLVATNGAGTEASEDGVFATFSPATEASCANEARRSEQHSTGLPDCRAYEMVSPPVKNGGDVMAVPERTRASVNGDAAAFGSLAAFADAHGIGISAEYIAERDGTPGTQGWSTHSIMPKLEAFGLNQATFGYPSMYRGEFSADLSRGILQTGTNLSGDSLLGNVANLYLRSDLLSLGEGNYSTVTLCPVCTVPYTQAQQEISKASFAGANADFGQIVFETALNLTAEASGEEPKTYEWDHGVVRLVGILPASEGGGVAPASVAGTGASNASYTLHIISADGRRVFFTDNSKTFGRTGVLYMRVDHAETVHINASEKAAPDEPQPARFETASTDGTKVFFRTSESLIEGNSGSGLYMYDVNAPAGEHLTLISVDHEPAGPGGSVTGVAGASEDGNYVYFFASNQLVAGAPPIGSSGNGIYAWHQGSLRYLGRAGGLEDAQGNSLGETYALSRLGSRVSPDGRHLLFTSLGVDEDPTVNKLYIYSYPTESLICASCNPSGAAATVNAGFTLRIGLGASQPTSHLGHALSDDGRFVFFTTAERLVGEDTNGVEDTYSYDSQTGQVQLLSSGTSPAGSYFLDATPNGANTFFGTRERLVGWDGDGAYDLYSARSQGGFPEPPPQPGACAGEGCQGAGVANAVQASAGSAVFAGPGNLKGNRCRNNAKQRKSKQRNCRQNKRNKHHHKRANNNRRTSR
jgi:hypothetical protein